MSGHVLRVDPSPTALPVGRVAGAVAAYEGLQRAWSTARSIYEQRLVYTVTINESDHLYGDVHAWLLQIIPTDTQRALVIATSTGHNDAPVDADDTDDGPPPFRLLFNDRRRRRIYLDGHRITIEVRRPDPAAANLAELKRAGDSSIIFSAHTKAGQDAVLNHIEQLHKAKGTREPVLRICNQWGSWSRRSDLPLRDLDSVVLPTTQKKTIVEDLRAFLANEHEYVRLALPWHRGYLLHGPPGTGKTSLVKALAHEFKLDLWYVALGDLKQEASLMNLLGDVSPRSMLLLEDVDTIQLTHDRDETPTTATTATISLSSLLNALDGVATPHGLITVMTTNHFDRLDPALTRAGRMDRVEELALPTWREAHAMFARFYGPNHTLQGRPDDQCPLTQAELSETFKRHFGDPDAAARALACQVRPEGVPGQASSATSRYPV